MASSSRDPVGLAMGRYGPSQPSGLIVTQRRAQDLFQRGIAGHRSADSGFTKADHALLQGLGPNRLIIFRDQQQLADLLLHFQDFEQPHPSAIAGLAAVDAA